MLNPFFQYLYCTVLYENFNNLLPTFSRCAAVNYYTLYSAREMKIYYCVTVPQKYEFAALNFIVLNVVYQALTSAYNSYEERTRC